MEALFPMCSQLRKIKNKTLEKSIKSLVLRTPGNVMARVDPELAVELIDRFIAGGEDSRQIMRKI